MNGDGDVLQETPDSDDSENALVVSMSVQAPVGITRRIESTQSIELVDETGVALAPAWTGNPLSYHTWQGPQRIVRTTTQREQFLEGGAGARGRNVFELPSLGDRPGATFVLISTKDNVRQNSQASSKDDFN